MTPSIGPTDRAEASGIFSMAFYCDILKGV